VAIIFGYLVLVIEICSDKSVIVCAGNTALVYHGGKFMALNEGDKPCKLKRLCIVEISGTVASRIHFKTSVQLRFYCTH